MQPRVFPEGASVEVWRPNRDEWVRGRVFGFKDGKYLIQLSGYAACEASDPNCWFTADEMRAAS